MSFIKKCGSAEPNFTQGAAPEVVVFDHDDNLILANETLGQRFVNEWVVQTTDTAELVLSMPRNDNPRLSLRLAV